ncbi:MAG: hypothetical protein ACMUHB_02040 [Thermoplasmatota archaeon]
MAATTGTDRYNRVETFLDNIDQVKDPAALEEPFRSLWLRVHGDMPTLMSDEDMQVVLTSGFGTAQLSDVEITSSEGTSFKGAGKGGIEVVSPKDVGPTVEMKVKEEKVRFKAAGEEDIQRLRSREEAASKVVNIQKITIPLKGIGGEAARISEKVRNMALLYRDGDFEKVSVIANDIERTVESEDFKKSVLLDLQKKISEYEGLGGDVKVAKERFKDMAAALKERREDFLTLAQATNKLAEDAIKDLVTVEEVVLAEVPEVKEEPKPQPKPEPKPEAEKSMEEAPVKKEPAPPKKKPELPGETGEDLEEEIEVTPKPVIKIIKKKVVVVRKAGEDFPKLTRDEEPEDAPEPISREGSDDDDGSPDDFSIDLEDEEDEDDGPVPKVDEVIKEDKKPHPETRKEEAKPPQKEGPAKESIEAAFKKIELVYKAAVAMHGKGKDVSQIFDMMKVAEDSRQKGDMRMYVGIAGQLENMLISMQK